MKRKNLNSSYPKYSILIGVYGHYEYLRHCIESALAQPSGLTEIIIVDDGSPDPRVAQLLSEYGRSNHDRIKLYLRKKNKGIITIWNKMIDYANGEYLVFLDCDDFLSSDAIYTVDRIITATSPSPAYLFSDRRYVDADEKLLSVSHYAVSHEIIDHVDHANNLLIEMLATHLKVIKKASLLEIGGFDDASSGVQDYDIALKMSEKYKLQYIDKPLYNYRIHPNTVTNSKRTDQHIRSGMVLRDALRRRGEEKLKSGRVYVNERSVSEDEVSQFLAYQRLGLEVNVHITNHNNFTSIIPKIGLIDRIFADDLIYKEVEKELEMLLDRSYIVLEPSSKMPVERFF